MYLGALHSTHGVVHLYGGVVRTPGCGQEGHTQKTAKNQTPSGSWEDATSWVSVSLKARLTDASLELEWPKVFSLDGHPGVRLGALSILLSLWALCDSVQV